MALEVGLSPVTVATAISELRRRGVVVTEPRRGIRVGERPPIGAARAPLPVPQGARDLSQGNPDPTLLPDLKRALAGTNLPSRLYGEPAVLPELAQLAGEQMAADGIAGGSLCIVSGALDGIDGCSRRTYTPAIASPSRTRATRPCSTCCALAASRSSRSRSTTRACVRETCVSRSSGARARS